MCRGRGRSGQNIRDAQLRHAVKPMRLLPPCPLHALYTVAPVESLCWPLTLARPTVGSLIGGVLTIDRVPPEELITS